MSEGGAMIARSKFIGPRSQWSWRFGRRERRPATIEQRPDGQWSVVIGRQVIGVVASREVAEELIDKLDAKAERSNTMEQRAKSRA